MKLVPAVALLGGFALAAGALVWMNSSVLAQQETPVHEQAEAAPEIQVAKAVPAPEPVEQPDQVIKAVPGPVQQPVQMAQAAASDAAAVSSDASPAAPASGPRIFCAEPEYDFGALDNSQKVQHDFVVKNVGTELLEIASVKTTCGCTVADLKKKKLEPGEETVVSATLSIAGRQGAQMKHLTVESNDPVQRLFRLTMKGVAQASVNVEPRSVNLGRIVDDAPRTQTIAIDIEKSRRPLRVTEVVSTAPDEFTAELKTIEEGGKYEVIVSSVEGLKSGPHSAQIRIKTDDPQNTEIVANVAAQVVGEIEVMPQQLVVHSSRRDGESSSQYLRVTGGRVREFEIKEVIAPVEAITVDVQQRAKNDYLVNVKNMPTDGSLDGKELIIKTNVESRPEVRVPFITSRPINNDDPLPLPGAGGAAGAQ